MKWSCVWFYFIYLSIDYNFFDRMGCINPRDDIILMRSRLYGMLSKFGGLDRVKVWKTDDIFSKSAIVIPINHGDHWALSIICNPGAIVSDERSNDEDLKPAHIYLDSKRSYTDDLEGCKEAMHQRLIDWLNMKWNTHGDRKIKDPFSKDTLPFYEPNGMVLL